jgi:hypothetical protein
MHASTEASGFPGPDAGNHEENDQPRRTVDGRRRGAALVFAPVASAASSANPGPHAAPSSPPGASQYGSGEDPLVPSGTWAPGDIVPYDLYIKNPGGGVDLPS